MQVIVVVISDDFPVYKAFHQIMLPIYGVISGTHVNH